MYEIFTTTISTTLDQVKLFPYTIHNTRELFSRLLQLPFQFQSSQVPNKKLNSESQHYFDSNQFQSKSLFVLLRALNRNNL